ANIFKWALREVRDLNGNSTRYHYDVVDGGGAAGEEPWHQLYLSSIRYTGSNGAEGPYEVAFNRESGRPDSVVDGRAGFKTVLDQRLASIEVRQLGMVNPRIRLYTFQYDTGPFSKSRLIQVTQKGEDGTTELSHHNFDYF